MKLPRHKGSLTIKHNPHKDCYDPIEDWIDRTLNHSDWVSPDEKQAAIDNDSVWVIRWYPDTPVSFCELAASSLEAILEAAGSAEGGVLIHEATRTRNRPHRL